MLALKDKIDLILSCAILLANTNYLIATNLRHKKTKKLILMATTSQELIIY